MQETQEMQITWIPGFLGQEGPLEEETATHCSILTWKIPWTEELGGLQSAGPQSQTRVSDWAGTADTWRRDNELFQKWDGERHPWDGTPTPQHTWLHFYFSPRVQSSSPINRCMTGFWGLRNYSSLTNNTAINHRKTSPPAEANEKGAQKLQYNRK